MNSMKKVQKNKIGLDPWYVTGLIDGEGCFCLIVNTENKKRKHSISTYRYWVVDFSLHMREDDRPILEKVQKFFQAGRLNAIVKHGAVHFNIRDRMDIITKLIPHFEKYPLQAKKQKDFLLWKEAVLILEQSKTRKKSLFDGQHLSQPEEERLYSIKDLLAQRLSGRLQAEYLAHKGSVQTGKTVSSPLLNVTTA